MTQIASPAESSPAAGNGHLQVGLHALGVGTGSRPEIISAVAMAADAAGFATLWCGEHVVMVDSPRSRYPYSGDGRIAVPPDADWLDPLLGLSFIAARTQRIRLATGILLLPEHNPLVVAKQAATLDVLSAGRFALGVGIGWSAEEFAALGVPFARRGARTDEYIRAMRRVWASEVASFYGEFVRFEGVRVYPKPVGGRRIPVMVGGTTDAALRACGIGRRRLVRLQPGSGRCAGATERARCGMRPARPGHRQPERRDLAPRWRPDNAARARGRGRH